MTRNPERVARLAAADRAAYEDATNRFDERWLGDPGTLPDIRDYLPAGGPARLAVLIDLIRTDLEARQKRGEPRAVQDYCAAFPELRGDAAAVRELEEWQAHLGLRPRDPAPPGYEILGEIGKGGMGVVWRARDLRLQRTLAVKVMREKVCDDANAVRRFLAEARITGQLAHPFIVPVHATGRLPDNRPYYTMKLVEGETFAVLLRQRSDPAARRQELVQVFGQVCQAVAFAHSRGIIHRDLKPANVMVGMHGEVQVMDWGLAKELSTPAIPRVEAGAGDETVDDTRYESDDRTRTGSVLGTYAYMPPEQARGQVGEVDKRSDVFGLGAILCEVLTGAAPYTGLNTWAVQLEATDARLDDALNWLRACGADPELIRLAERCLAPRKSDRPADAGEVAAAVAAYQAAVQERLQQERLELERQKVQTAEERRRRKLWAGLAAAVLAAVCVAAAGGLYWQRQEAQRRQLLARAEDDMRLAEEQLRLGRLEEAGESLTRARDRAGTNSPGAGGDYFAQLEKAWRLAITLERIQLDRTTPTSAGLFDNATAQRRYGETFGAAGLDLDNGDREYLVAAINRSPVQAKILEAIDNWALVCTYDMRFEPENQDAHEKRRDRLLELARQVDPDPELRDHIRNPAVWTDREHLEELAERARRDRDLKPRLAAFLAELLRWAEADPEPLLRTYQARHRGDFWLNFDLGKYLHGRKPDEAMQFYQAALAVHPRHVFVLCRLGNIYPDRGNPQAAIALYEEALAVDDTLDFVRRGLGDALRRANRRTEAIEQYRRCSLGAYAHNPFLAKSLGEVLEEDGKLVEAAEQYRKALQEIPKLNPANQFFVAGKEVCREGLEAAVRKALGDVLVRLNDQAAALQEYRNAVRLWPEFAAAHLRLGALLKDLGDGEGAARHVREAWRHDPGLVLARLNLGLLSAP